jgi:hypothetical protein
MDNEVAIAKYKQGRKLGVTINEEQKTDS